MASQGEGKKRRSFLPAPKKSSGVSPTSPQPPSNVPVPQQQQQSLSSSFSSTTTSSLGKAPSSSSSSYGDREPPKLAPEKPQQADVTKAEKPTEELAFGIGLRVGARVKIGGVKPGILRYLGTTHLAPGIFCGIELFDPEGKHDGEVGGHRYFNCAPKYGIFAPKEKVCLDTSQPLGRLSSDSDNCYSSTESLSERTQKAFRTFSEGELEAVDCTKLSPILSPEDGEARYSDTKARHIKGSRLPGKGRLTSAYELVDPASISDSLDQQEVLSEIPTKKQKSGLPRARSSLPTPASSQSRLPSYSSRAYGDGIPTYKLSSTYSSQTAEALPTKTICRPPQAGSSVDPNPENDKYPGGSARSSEDSEEDGGTRDTLSTGIKKQLRADSRQYLNFTFDPEELSHSQDSDNDLDTKGKQQNATNPLYSDPRFMRDISGDSSDESLGVLSPRVISSNSLCASENFMRVESGTLLCQDIPCVTSTPTPGRQRDSGAVKSDSYTIEPSSARQDLDMSISSAGTEGDTSALSATRSISDSDLPPELLPSVGDGRDGGLSATFLTSDVQRLSEGGYLVDTSGDGSSGGLNLTQTLDSHKSESFIISRDPTANEVSQSQSFTICSHETEGRRESVRREKDSTVVASQSYTISKSDSAASSPSRKYRKISSSSSANENGDSSSSGPDPKTDSSGENKGENLDDSSTGVSPEVSQALEWDYGQEFDGKIPPSHQESAMTTSASTGTSESLSDVLRDDHSDGIIEAEMPSSVIDDSDQFETPDNEFENIDSLEDFPIFGKDARSVMTDSGISDKDFDFNPTKSSSSTVCGNSSDECSREDDASSHTTTKAVSSDSSQETLAAEYVADTPGSIEDKEFICDEMAGSYHGHVPEEICGLDSCGDGNSNSPASVVSVEDASIIQDRTLLCEDMNDETDRPQVDSSEDMSSSSNTTVVVKGAALAGRSPTGMMNGATSDFSTDLEDEFVDSDDKAMSRRERPVSLLSTASADTGYVPDTDSELGTLTTTSPNTDWVDRLGVTHPTSYAPLDQADGTAGQDIGYIQKQTAQCQSVTTPTATAPQLQTTKPSDDEDYNSDLPTTAEDDRIEADQVYQPPAISTPSGTLSPGHEEGSPVDPGETTITPDQSGQLADPNSSIDSTVSVQKEGEDENKEGKGSNKEDSGQQRKSRPKKPLTITKKRSENIDHKLPNTSKVRSTLADYIKAPPPVKPKEEKEKEQKEKELKKKMSKNAKNAIQKRMSVTELSKSRTKIDTSRASSVDRANIKRDTSSDRNRVEKPPEKPKPIIKRTPPKSKWGNIMSQIESSKDNVKPKPKSEIKSSLAAYLNAPPPAPSPATTGEDSNNITVNMVKTDQPNTKRPKRESRIKPLPPPPPKIDLSKVKSKLNVPTAASANKTIVKRETSPSGSRTRNVSKTSRESSPAAPAVAAATKENVAPAQRKSEGNIVLVRQPLEDGVSSVRSSRTDLSVCDSVDSAAESRADEEATPSKRGSVDFTKKDRRLSTNSLKSEPADKSRSRREQNKATYTKRTHTIEVKSTIPPFTPIKIPSRAIEIRIGDGSNVSSQRSSPTPIIVKPVKPKPKTNAKTVTSTKPAWGAGKPTPSPTAASVKGRDSGSNQARKPRVNGTAKSVIASTNNARSSSSTTSTTSAAQKEIVRLESLCEARTKELTHTKMQLKATTQGFDAMAVLVNYCCAELNAFECPTLAKKLEVVQKQLTDCLSQIADLTAQKESLDQNLTQVTQEKDEATKRAEEALSAAEKQKEEHAKLTHELDDTHNAALTTQRDELTSKHAEEQNKIRQYYDKQIDLIKHAHDRQMSDLKNEHKLEINGMKISHLEEIQELRNKHDDQMEELHKQHRNKLEDITHRFESIKLTLSEKVESLRGECDEMTRRARCSEEALQRDADVKVQIALAPYLNLPKEIESLKTVVEMRNEEIQKLRSKNMDLEKQLEELPIAKEKIISLQQKVENLEAIINIKTDHEKQLHEKCQVLMRKYDRESRANKRLSMDYEQVMWRMSQSSEFGSCESLTKRHFSRSPPRSEASSPDPRRRNLSPNDAANGEVVMRVKKRNSHSLSEDDRKLRSRSATFVVEKENSESRSPSSSPQLKQKRWRKKSQTEELAAQDQAERMCHSAGAELMSEIASQQHKVVEQLKSEMTDSQDSSSSCVAMASSYARSLSGVSDSGVYDSMTRSELNSSMVSTDSEFGTSVNLSMNLDSTMDEYESGPQAGDYNSITDTTVIPGKGSSSTSDSGNVNCGSVSGDSVTNGVSTASSDNNTSTDHGDSKNCSNYEFQVSLPDGTTDDNVFDDSYSLDSPNTTSDSITFVEANVSDSKLTSATAATENVDTAVSSPHTVTDVQDTSSPQDSSTKSS